VILANAPCDVCILVGGGARLSGPVVTPFGGVDNDWSAIELAAWLARSLDTTLRLLGTRAIPRWAAVTRAGSSPERRRWCSRSSAS
jgi:hypothetical protein